MTTVPTPDDIVIGVMGVTGVGKSTFINYFAHDDVEIGNDLESCTETINLYQCSLPGIPRFFLVDTPGFDDSSRSDAEVLEQLAKHLATAWCSKIKLSGLIYLHRIMDVRFGGASGRNLRMFRKLCGDDNLSSVVLATTFWKDPATDIERQRESQLQSDPKFWKGMIDRGSKVMRQDREMQSGMEIIKYLVEKRQKVVLNIQHQLVDQNMTIAQTDAGTEVLAEIAEMTKRHEEELARLRLEMKQAIKDRDVHWQDMLAKERAEWENRIERDKKATSKLSTRLTTFWEGVKFIGEDLAWEVADRFGDKCVAM